MMISDAEKTRYQLLAELRSLRRQVAQLKGRTEVAERAVADSLDHEARLQEIYGRVLGALHQADQRLQSYIDYSPLMIVEWDAAGRLLYWSREAEQFFGWKRDEVLGKRSDEWRFIFEEDRAAIDEIIERLLSGAEVRNVGLNRNYRRNGTVVHCEWYNSAFYDEDGRLEKVLSLVLDVTERRQAELRLRESEKRYRRLVELSFEAVAIMDEEQLIEINPAGAHLLGTVDSATLPGQRLAELLHPDSLAMFRHHLLEAKDTGGEVSLLEERFMRRDGRELDIEFASVPVRYRGQEAYQIVIRDVSQRKQAARKVIDAERLAALGRLAAALAHEMNNPLQAIQSNLDLVLDFSLEQEERDRYLQVVRQEIERLSKANQRVLNYARPRQAARQLVSLPELLEPALLLMAKSLKQGGIEVKRHWQPVPQVKVVPTQLTQVFLNLLLNAQDYLGSGGTIDIFLSGSADQVTIAFANDGPVIPPEIMPRIFEPFCTTKEDGVGIGLWISHSLVRQNGGTLTVANLGLTNGVIFKITLPTG